MAQAPMVMWQLGTYLLSSNQNKPGLNQWGAASPPPQLREEQTRAPALPGSLCAAIPMLAQGTASPA